MTWSVLNREYSRSPGLLNIRFTRSRPISCIQRLGKGADPLLLWLHHEDATKLYTIGMFSKSVLILGYEHFSWSEHFECGNLRFRFVFEKPEFNNSMSAIFQSACVAYMNVSFPNIAKLSGNPHSESVRNPNYSRSIERI